jgi:hypothetical protein
MKYSYISPQDAQERLVLTQIIPIHYFREISFHLLGEGVDTYRHKHIHTSSSQYSMTY